MSVFDQINSTPPEGNAQTIRGVFWCHEAGCFDVVEEATQHTDAGMITWTCEEGHKNKEKDVTHG